MLGDTVQLDLILTNQLKKSLQNNTFHVILWTRQLTELTSFSNNNLSCFYGISRLAREQRLRHVGLVVM